MPKKLKAIAHDDEEKRGMVPLSEVRRSWEQTFRSRSRMTNATIEELDNWRAEIEATIAFLKAHQR